MDRNNLTVIKGGKDENSSPSLENRPIPKCKFCSQPMIAGEKDTYYCTCKKLCVLFGFIRTNAKVGRNL